VSAVPYDAKRSPRPEATAGEAARVGEELRDARAALGYSIEEMAGALRINRRYLAALEEGRVRDLPGPAYALGFVRSYSSALGLDADEMVRRFRESSSAAARGKHDLVFPEPVPDRGVPAGATVLFGALIAIGGYVLWWQSAGTGQRVVDAVPPLPPALERAAEIGAAQLPGPAATAPVAQAPAAPPVTANGTGPASGATPPPAGAAPTAPATAPNGTPAPGAPLAPALPPPSAGVEPGRLALPRADPPPLPEISAAGIPFPAPAAPPPPAPPAAAAAPAAAAPRLLLRATQPAWVQVRDPRGGQVLVNQTLRGGETWEVPADRQGLVLDTGRAEALVIEVDGRAVPALTGRTGVVRGIVLDPARLAN
jgi:cytoskeleton protein RodZ